MEPGVHQERADAGDVEELGADGVLDLPLLAAIDDATHEHDGEHGDEREESGQAKAQAIPEAETWTRAVARPGATVLGGHAGD